MNNDIFINLCKEQIVDYTNKTTNFSITNNNVYIVWFCKTLQNWKALCSTDIQDDLYYEITFNGNKNELYLDVYKKQNNITLKL